MSEQNPSFTDKFKMTPTLRNRAWFLGNDAEISLKVTTGRNIRKPPGKASNLGLKRNARRRGGTFGTKTCIKSDFTCASLEESYQRARDKSKIRSNKTSLPMEIKGACQSHF